MVNVRHVPGLVLAHGGSTTMRECSYELYVAAYEAVRQGLEAGDADVVRRVSAQIGRRPGVAGLVITLALVEAKRGDPERTKEQVCQSARCAEWCAAGTGRS